VENATDCSWADREREHSFYTSITILPYNNTTASIRDSPGVWASTNDICKAQRSVRDYLTTVCTAAKERKCWEGVFGCITHGDSSVTAM